ncbi:MAG TPA: hypothetical protein VF453_11805 [Burkholderiaceae bacterium]
MQRFLPPGLALSSIAVVLSTTLAACGGGSTDTSSAASTQSTTDSSASTTASTDASIDTGTVASTVDTNAQDGSAATAMADAAANDAATAKPIISSSDLAGTTVTQAGTTATAGTGGTTSGTTAAATAGAQSSGSDSVAPASSGLASIGSGTPGDTTRKASGAGLNLSAFNYFSPEIPTFDVMKRGSPWLTQCSTSTLCANFTGGAGTWETLEESKLPLDANGYPTSLPAANDTTVKYRKVTTMLSSNGSLPPGQYTIVYDGAGTLAYGGSVSIVSSKPGRDVVNLAAGSTSSFWLSITATSASNHLRNIRVYLPGGACANDLTTYAASASACTASQGAFVPFESFPAGSTWNPQFLTDVKGFRTLRFMDWGQTNSTALSSWSNRPLITDRTWTSANGVPLEAMFDLANKTSADPWINIPPHADDNYITQAAKVALQAVDASHKINLEYGNEMWNYSFPATKWALAQAQAAWPAEVAAGANVYELESNWYARRLVQACTLAKGAGTGAASRFTCISNTQASVATQTDQVLRCTYAAKTLGQPCAKFIDVAAVAPYFGQYTNGTAFRPTVTTWYALADGGLSNLFAELTGTDANGTPIVKSALSLVNSAAPAGGALSQLKGWMQQSQAIAAKYGLPLWTYEGGQGLVPQTNDTDTHFINLTIAANRDARMGQAYQRMFSDWQAVGGQVFTYYSHVATPGKFGSWGAKETMTDNGNAKWVAVKQARDTACWWTGC